MKNLYNMQIGHLVGKTMSWERMGIKEREEKTQGEFDSSFHRLRESLIKRPLTRCAFSPKGQDKLQ